MVLGFIVLVIVGLTVFYIWASWSGENDLERKGVPACKHCGRRSHHFHNF